MWVVRPVEEGRTTVGGHCWHTVAAVEVEDNFLEQRAMAEKAGEGRTGEVGSQGM